jgi:tetrapyrrole methylase family protein/MazG family protein
VPQTLPALLRAYQIQARASRVGFDWSHDQAGFDQVLNKIEEEIRELRMALRLPPSEGETSVRQQEIAAEFGDVLFSLVNMARFVKVNPEDTLRQAINRFVKRFQFIEQQAAQSGRAISDLSFDEMNRLWEEAKTTTDTRS